MQAWIVQRPQSMCDMPGPHHAQVQQAGGRAGAQARPGSPTRAAAGAGSPTPTRLRSSGCSPIARPAARRTSLRTVVRPAPLSAFLCVCGRLSPGALALTSHTALLPLMPGNSLRKGCAMVAGGAAQSTQADSSSCSCS